MRVELPYLGKRNYVHGGTIVNMVLERLQPGFPFEIKFHSPVWGRIEIRNEAVGKPNVTLSFLKEGLLTSFGLFDMGGGRLDNRVHQDESSVVRLCRLQGKTISSPHDSSETLIARTLVMNKELMASVFPDVQGKWWFASLIADAWPNTVTNVELTFDGGLGTKLTRSIVKADGYPIAKLFFSLVPA